MKTILIGLVLAGLSFGAAADDCAQLVHTRTLVPMGELSTLAPNGTGITTVIRHRDTSHTVFGVEVTKGTIISTSYQCDGQGKYRQLLPNGWSIWRTGNEWNAEHWMVFER